MYKKMTLDINTETGIIRMETFQVPKGTKRLTIMVEKDLVCKRCLRMEQ